MAVNESKKIEAHVVEAIRRLQANQGSTPREISNYISQEYNFPSREIRRYVQVALKHGVTYGILQRLKGGYYTYNQDVWNGLPAIPADVGIPCHARRRRRMRRRSRGRGRKFRRTSRRSRRSKRRKSRQRRGSRRGRRRANVAEEIDRLERKQQTKQRKRSSSPLSKESQQSDVSSISGFEDEKRE